MASQDIELMAHLMRRAGFGATRDELESYIDEGYEATVEELLNPGDPGILPYDLVWRRHVSLYEGLTLPAASGTWMHRMINTRCPLQEKVTFFWHTLFATGYAKVSNAMSLLNQSEILRRHCLGNFRDLLVEISKDPAMIIWLDNNDNHNGAINENYGRELLELFAMGVGNYSEEDIKECARAFTGWTLDNAEYMAARALKVSLWPYGNIGYHFAYRPEDHDDGEKSFLGETGRFNGEDVIDIIVKQPATARFVCTRLFLFFAADEVSEAGQPVIEEMIGSYFDSGHEIAPVLRTLFNSAYFKSEDARYARVKGPVELAVGAFRLAGSHRELSPAVGQAARAQVAFMGQDLLDAPSVEGWHEGVEWIHGNGLLERVNFMANEFADPDRPGVRAIIERLASGNGTSMSPSELVDRCLDLMGPVPATEDTRAALTEHVARRGELALSERQPGDESEQRVGELLGLIASTREFQFA